eukprot:scaffold64719_cov37-Tisochrysis_lutea.AAC.3
MLRLPATCEQRPWKSLAHSNASTPSLHISGLLHAAALNADVDLVEECLREGADPAFADSNGLTALHFAGFVGGEAGPLLHLPSCTCCPSSS